MKIIYILIFLSYFSYSQSFQLIEIEQKVEADITIQEGDDDWRFTNLDLDSYVQVVNTSQNTVQTNLIVDFKENAGSQFAICDDQLCYTGIMDDWTSFGQTGRYMQWTAGANSDDFISGGMIYKMTPYTKSPFQNPDLSAEEIINNGITVIEVTLQNTENVFDFLTFEIRYEVSLNGVLSVDVNEIASGINLYPNPVSDYLNLDYSGSQINELLNSTIQIVDLQGNMVYEGNYSSSTSVNVSNLSSGKYIQRIIFSDGRAVTLPFIKE